MTAPATVGVVIAAFNAEAFIAATLQSVVDQTFSDWTCAIVDDGSTDGTGSIAREFAAADRRFSVVRVANGGHCAARNLAIDALSSRVDAITVMDADDVWLPHALDALVTRVRARPDCIGAHALGEFIDAAGELVAGEEFSRFGRERRTGRSGRLRNCPPERDTTFDVLATASTVFPPGLLLMRREIYARVGGYDPVSVEGDWDLLLRATRHGPLAYVDEVVVHYRRHATNFGGREEIALHTHMTLVRAFDSPLNSPDQLQTLRACWRARQIEAMRAQVALLGVTRPTRSAGERAARLLLAAGRYARGRPRAPLRARCAAVRSRFARSAGS
jgi:glycosyltransferase involved in cell wall biosynthesis